MVVKHEEKHHERVEQQICQHYWVIESAVNRVSVGVCRLCVYVVSESGTD